MAREITGLVNAREGSEGGATVEKKIKKTLARIVNRSDVHFEREREREKKTRQRRYNRSSACKCRLEIARAIYCDRLWDESWGNYGMEIVSSGRLFPKQTIIERIR